jgi:hypothetical protein
MFMIEKSAPISIRKRAEIIKSFIGDHKFLEAELGILDFARLTDARPISFPTIGRLKF